MRAINDIYGFNEDGDNIIVFAPRGVDTTDVSIRLSDASFVNGEIDFLRKIRENTYEYVGWKNLPAHSAMCGRGMFYQHKLVYIHFVPLLWMWSNPTNLKVVMKK